MQLSSEYFYLGPGPNYKVKSFINALVHYAVKINKFLLYLFNENCTLLKLGQLQNELAQLNAYQAVCS